MGCYGLLQLGSPPEVAHSRLQRHMLFLRKFLATFIPSHDCNYRAASAHMSKQWPREFGMGDDSRLRIPMESRRISVRIQAFDSEADIFSRNGSRIGDHETLTSCAVPNPSLIIHFLFAIKGVGRSQYGMLCSRRAPSYYS